MMTENFLDSLNQQVESHLNDSFQTSDAARLGLDPRAGYFLYVGDQFIVVKGHQRSSLEYYGGFEYVDKAQKMTYGDYTFYSSEDGRVAECLDRFFDRVPVEVDADEE